MHDRTMIYARNESGVVKRMPRSSLQHKQGWTECDAPPPRVRKPRRKRAPKNPGRKPVRAANLERPQAGKVKE